MASIIRKILNLLTKRERKRLYMLFGAMAASALLEVAGIVSIFPFLDLVTDPSAIEDNRVFAWLYNFFNFQRFYLF